MSRVRSLCLTALFLSIAIVSSSGLSETFDCRKNEPIPDSESECKECFDVAAGFVFMGQVYYSKSCSMSTYPINQQCTIETNEDGIICYVVTANCAYMAGSVMRGWRDHACMDFPRSVGSCDPKFQFVAGGWQDQGEVPICPPE